MYATEIFTFDEVDAIYCMRLHWGGLSEEMPHPPYVYLNGNRKGHLLHKPSTTLVYPVAGAYLSVPTPQ